MNVLSAASTATLFTPKDPPAASPLAAARVDDRAASAGGKSGGSAPALDVTKKLKALSEQMLAVMLINDPVQRAKAAAQLYKQYAQTAKDYAGATADGRSAAAAAETVAANGAAPTAQDGETAAADTADAPAAQASPPAAEPAAVGLPPELAAAAQATTPSPIYLQGRKPTFVADIYMEQIKTFAGAAQQIYESAVEEARQKRADKSKLPGLREAMRDAEEVLTEAAKAVEGPDATADGYDAVGVATAASGGSIMNVTA